MSARARGKRRRSRLRYLPGGWSDHTDPVNVVLVDHPAGLCLFDTGPGRRLTLSGAFPGVHPWLRLTRFEPTEADAVGVALAARGATREDVRTIVLSHLHVDHVGGVEEYPVAELVVSRREWERATGLPGRLRGYVPSLVPTGRATRLVEPRGPAVGPFPASFDVHGDGSLVVVPAPGHTPGHLALLVERAGGTLLCGGDLGASLDELARNAPAVARWCTRTGVEYVGAHTESRASPVSSR